jgi:hypothetical protein
MYHRPKMIVTLIIMILYKPDTGTQLQKIGHKPFKIIGTET